MNKSDDIIEIAISLLLHEKKVLLSGDLIKLKALEIKKSKLKEELECINLNEVCNRRVVVLRAQAQMNANLFEAARAGLESVKQRVDSISCSLFGFQVYGPNRRINVLQNLRVGKII